MRRSVIALAAAAGAVACGAVAPPPGSVSAAMISDPHSFNPIIDNDVSTNAILGRVFDGLIDVEAPDQRIVPALAETWSVSPDGRTWTFRLRPDLRWSDGVPLTADDVVFTFRDLVYNDSIVTSIRDALQVEGRPFDVSATDSRTVTLTTAKPFAPFLRSIGVPIVPRHHLEAAVRAGTFSSTWGVGTPPADVVGTGPFRIAEYVPGDRVVLAPNPHHWRRDLPHLDRLVFRIVPDVDAGLLWFLARAIDFTGLRPPDVPLVKTLIRDGRPIRLVDRGPSSSIEFIGLNMSEASSLPDWKRRLLRDGRFRRALAHAVDRRGIIETVWNGMGYEQDGPIERANPVYFDTGIPRRPYDVAEAERLLDDLGLVRGPDGIRRDAEGHRIEIEIMTNANNNERVKEAALVQENWRSVGIEARVAAIEWNTMLKRLDVDFDWDAVLIGLHSYSIDPHDGSNVFRSDGGLHFWNQKPSPPAADAPDEAKVEYERRLAAWRAGIFDWERRIDSLMDAEVTELDEAQRKGIFSEVQRLIAENVPMIYLPSVAYVAASWPRIGSFEPDPYLTAFHNAWAWTAE